MNPFLLERIARHLQRIYPAQDAAALVERAIEAIGGAERLPALTAAGGLTGPTWSERDIAVITYGDSVTTAGYPPLATLERFVDRHLADVVSIVHILPFFPFTSDDGFAIVDFAEVNPDLGSWAEITSIAQGSRVMADLVLNHVSASSAWFQQFERGELPGRDYFVVVDPAANLDSIVRPRTSPLLREVDTPDGTQHVWATFSHDQLDLNFENPDVLFEFLRFINQYLDAGVTMFRLDAVGYLWKQLGTTSIHLPKTHEVVKLIRLLLELREPDALLITETNVPHEENVSYFGHGQGGQEAHLVYNFTLPPLVLHALLVGRATALRQWIGELDALAPGTSYFNFLASHDGIGLRPVEGLLSDEDQDVVVEAVRRNGGLVSMFTAPGGGERPYELNISLFEAMRGNGEGVDDGLQVDRFCAAHAIMLAFVGVPAFYIHSLLATPNNLDGVTQTGVNRTINRAKLDFEAVVQELDRTGSSRREVLERLRKLSQVRQSSPAFHPEADQQLLETSDQVLGLRRTSLANERVDVYVNVSASEAEVHIGEPWRDLLTGRTGVTTLSLPPYGTGWIVRR